MILSATPDNLAKAALELSAGDLVAFPTETVYGLGANALSDQAVQKIFDLKQRPANNPLIVHVASIEQARNLISKEASKKILDRFKKISILWPAPLSVIVPKSAEISKLCSAGGHTIAIRIPNHALALKLLAQVNLPIAAPSANKSFAVSPTTAAHVEDSFAGEDLTILDGGSCEIGLESTVLDITSDQVSILRPGSISAELVSQTLGESCFSKESKAAKNQKIIQSPGLFELHYAPKTPLIFFDELGDFPTKKKVGIIILSETRISEFASRVEKVIALSKDGNLEEVARNLYTTLRACDQLGLELIAIEKCEEQGIGLAIMDRLRRACHLQ